MTNTTVQMGRHPGFLFATYIRGFQHSNLGLLSTKHRVLSQVLLACPIHEVVVVVSTSDYSM